MSFSKQQLKIFAIVGGVILAVGVFLYFNLQPSKVTGPAIKLTVWGAEPQSSWNSLFAAYRSLRPNVSINYVEVKPQNYTQGVLDALAAGSGPDVFLVGNHDVSKRASVLAPVDATQFSSAQLDALFPRVVGEDMVRGGKIYGLPISLDAMVMAYNRDLFDAAGIATPPTTWDEVLGNISKLRQVNPSGEVTQAALALGGSEKSVDHAADTLQLLMFQNGTSMTDATGSHAQFYSSSNKGLAAFQFYLQFANPNSPYFTWSEQQGNSVDQFAAGKVAMILNYRSALDRVKAKSPFLRVGVSSVPLSSGGVPTSVASYPSLVVSKQSKVSPWAWDFVIFAATDVKANKSYRDEAGGGSALREVLAKDTSDVVRGPFARAALAARSWTVPDAASVTDIFSSAIFSVNTGNVNPDKALRDAEQQVSALYRQ